VIDRQFALFVMPDSHLWLGNIATGTLWRRGAFFQAEVFSQKD
jgi:hypothetical protein